MTVREQSEALLRDSKISFGCAHDLPPRYVSADGMLLEGPYQRGRGVVASYAALAVLSLDKLMCRRTLSYGSFINVAMAFMFRSAA